MKWVGSLVKLLITVLLASCISAVVTLYVIHMYVQEMLKPYQAYLPENKFELSEFVVQLWSQANILGRGGASEGKERTPEPKATRPEPGNRSEPDDAVAVWAETRSGGAGDKLVLSNEQLITKRNKLSDEDKMTVFSMLVSRLPQEEYQAISTMLEDGVTSRELEEMEKIVEKHLTPEQVEKLIQIVNKN